MSDIEHIEFNTGVVEDPRTEAEKAKDWKFEEIAGGVVAPLAPIVSWETFSVQYQLQSSSCVLQARAKAAEILRFRNRGEKINHSAGAYAVRPNRPQEGTYVPWALQDAVDHGIPFEEDIKSEKMSEMEMNSIPYLEKLKNIPDVRKTFVLNYIPYMPVDFDTTCQQIAAGNPVLLLVRCNILEWNQAVPQIYGGDKNIGHEICGVQAGLFSCTLRGNKGEAIVLDNTPVIRVDDSWGNLGFQGKGFRLITREWFDKYVVNVSMLTQFVYKSGGNALPTLPSNTVVYAQSGSDVKHLQYCLRYLGYFPTNVDIEQANNYGPMTRSMVKKFQLDNKVYFASLGTTEAKLRALDGKSFGPQSIALLKQLIK